MLMTWKAWTRPLIVWVLGYAIATAGAAYARDTKEILLVADPWCPFTCDAQSDKHGTMVDIARAILTPLGYRVTYENVAWTRALKGAVAGDYDGAVGTSIYEESQLIMSTAPLGKMENGIFVEASDPWRFTTLENLKGRKLGVIMGYAYGESLDRFLVDHPDIVEAKSGEDALRKNILQLTNKRIHGIIEDIQVVHYTAQAMNVKDQIIQASAPGAFLEKDFDVQKGGLFIGISPKHPEAKAIAEALGKGIETLRQSGELAKILSRYHVADWQAPTP